LNFATFRVSTNTHTRNYRRRHPFATASGGRKEIYFFYFFPPDFYCADKGSRRPAGDTGSSYVVFFSQVKQDHTGHRYTILAF
jgi:hypothetical protein